MKEYTYGLLHVSLAFVINIKLNITMHTQPYFLSLSERVIK